MSLHAESGSESTDTTNEDSVSRRAFLCAAMAAPPALAACGSKAALVAQPPEPAPDPPGTQDCTQCLIQPDEIRAENGVLNADLSIEYKTGVQAGSEQLDVRMYGYPDPANPAQTKFTFPGPTFRVRRGDGSTPGDRIQIGLSNNIQGAPGGTDDENCFSPNQGNDVAPNCFHGNNYTNFHFHGFHVSPEPPGDDVFLRLPPGAPRYQIAIDPLRADQAEGTHWYHPHKHGSTALQVLNGMAGAFIVEGPFDDEINALLPDMTELIFVVQDIGDTLKFPPGSPRQNYELLVNGQLNPTVQIRQGEIQRWRFVGATMHTAADIRVALHPLIVRQIAQDGVQFAPQNYANQLTMARVAQVANQPFLDLPPGNRVDFLVQAPVDRTGMFRMFASSKTSHLLEENVQADVQQGQATNPLFSVEVTEPARPMQFPTAAQFPKLPDFLRDIEQEEIVNTRLVRFQMTGDRGAQPQFLIDGKKFDPNCVDQRMKLGDAEEWTISNDSDIPHPCHIHVNPFQLIEYNGVTLPKPWVWWDTIALPPGSADDHASVRIRHRFLDFPGKYVMHCHILGHEDRGMMQVLEVGSQSGLPLCRPTA